MIKNILSIKQKSILFILLLISILLSTLYFQNRASNRNNLIQIEINYKNSFDNYYSFFKKNLIKFYEAQTTNIQMNENEKDKLILDEKYLKEINIVNLKKEKISTV